MGDCPFFEACIGGDSLLLEMIETKERDVA